MFTNNLKAFFNSREKQSTCIKFKSTNQDQTQNLSMITQAMNVDLEPNQTIWENTKVLRDTTFEEELEP